MLVQHMWVLKKSRSRPNRKTGSCWTWYWNEDGNKLKQNQMWTVVANFIPVIDQRDCEINSSVFFWPFVLSKCWIRGRWIKIICIFSFIHIHITQRRIVFIRCPIPVILFGIIKIYITAIKNAIEIVNGCVNECVIMIYVMNIEIENVNYLSENVIVKEN